MVTDLASICFEVNYGKLLHLRDFPTWRDFGQSQQQLLEKREPEVSNLIFNWPQMQKSILIFPDCCYDENDSGSSMVTLSQFSHRLNLLVIKFN